MKTWNISNYFFRVQLLTPESIKNPSTTPKRFPWGSLFIEKKKSRNLLLGLFKNEQLNVQSFHKKTNCFSRKMLFLHLKFLQMQIKKSESNRCLNGIVQTWKKCICNEGSCFKRPSFFSIFLFIYFHFFHNLHHYLFYHSLSLSRAHHIVFCIFGRKIGWNLSTNSWPDISEIKTPH